MTDLFYQILFGVVGAISFVLAIMPKILYNMNLG